MGQRCDAGGIQLLQLSYIAKDAAQITSEPDELFRRKGKRGQRGNMLDLGLRNRRKGSGGLAQGRLFLLRGHSGSIAARQGCSAARL